MNLEPIGVVRSPITTAVDEGWGAVDATETLLHRLDDPLGGAGAMARGARAWAAGHVRRPRGDRSSRVFCSRSSG